MASIAPQPSKRFPDGQKVRYRHRDGSAGALTFPDRRSADKFVKLVDVLGVNDALERIGRTPPPAPASPPVDRVLYRFFDEEGGLLYIGKTISAWKRFASHRRKSTFFPEAARVTLGRGFASDDELSRAEVTAIHAEKPRYNKIHNGSAVAVVSEFSVSASVTLLCDVCGKSVTGTAGYVCIDNDAVHRAREDLKEWDVNHVPVELLSQFGVDPSEISALISVRFGVDNYLEAVLWHIYHRDCDPDPGGNFYLLEAWQCNTERDFLGWSAFLFGTSWLRYTDWDEFVFRVLQTNGWREPPP